MKKSYVCNRFKSLSIGSSIKFEGGEFTTEDEALQGVVESNEWYKVHIHPKEHYPVNKPATAPAPEEESSDGGGVSSGLRGTKKMRF